ncbi:hypothetical protein ACIGXM_04530 [Kitasatospora sp. NPDC052896]|uniref:hypothetical protein n=1 Tax=Kitasatospora sp. NPDC052896 TaxID=3364061 RepID=UPI0037CBD932
MPAPSVPLVQRLRERPVRSGPSMPLPVQRPRSEQQPMSPQPVEWQQPEQRQEFESSPARSGAPTTAAPSTASAPPSPPEPQGKARPAERLIASLERKHLDELARLLAPPMGRLLRAELWSGRERAGRLLDGDR